MNTGIVNPLLLRRVTLDKWLTELNVKTSFSELKDTDIVLLWDIYQNRINETPKKSDIDNAISKGLNPNIFYSQEFKCDIKIPEYELSNNFENLGEIINQRLSDSTKSIIIRVGDVVRLSQYDKDGDNILFFDGIKLLTLSDFNIPHEILINQYPTIFYFSKVIDGYYHRAVRLETKELKLELIERLKDSETDLYKYKAGKYIIYTGNPHFEENWDQIQLLDIEPDRIEEVYGISEDMIKRILEEDNTNVLYDTNTLNN